MSDDKGNKSQVSTNASEESLRRPRIADPYAKLTDEDWRQAMIRGREFSDARDAAIGAGIRRGCEKSISEAHEALDQAQAALRTYLKRADPDQEDLLRHRSLVDDLKLATDNLKNATDEYYYLVSNRAAIIRPEST
jgi:hypothetical protein